MIVDGPVLPLMIVLQPIFIFSVPFFVVAASCSVVVRVSHRLKRRDMNTTGLQSAAPTMATDKALPTQGEGIFFRGAEYWVLENHVA